MSFLALFLTDKKLECTSMLNLCIFMNWKFMKEQEDFFFWIRIYYDLEKLLPVTTTCYVLYTILTEFTRPALPYSTAKI